MKYFLWGSQVEIVSEPNGLEARTDPVHLLPQVVVVTILVAQEVTVWIIAAIVARILLNKPIAKDFDGESLLPRTGKSNPVSRLEKGQLSQSPTACRTFAQQNDID